MLHGVSRRTSTTEEIHRHGTHRSKATRSVNLGGKCNGKLEGAYTIYAVAAGLHCVCYGQLLTQEQHSLSKNIWLVRIMKLTKT